MSVIIMSMRGVPMAVVTAVAVVTVVTMPVPMSTVTVIIFSGFFRKLGQLAERS